MAEMPTAESPTPVADTRHPKLDPPANHPVSGFPFEFLPLSPANWPTDQLMNHPSFGLIYSVLYSALDSAIDSVL